MPEFRNTDYASLVRGAIDLTNFPRIMVRSLDSVPVQQKRRREAVLKVLTELEHASRNAVKDTRNPARKPAGFSDPGARAHTLSQVMLRALGLVLFFEVPDRNVVPLLCGPAAPLEPSSLSQHAQELLEAVSALSRAYQEGIELRLQVADPMDGVVDGQKLRELSLPVLAASVRLLDAYRIERRQVFEAISRIPRARRAAA